MRTLLLLLVCSAALVHGKEAQYVADSSCVQEVETYTGEKFKVLWVALVGGEYHWQRADDGKKYSGAAKASGNYLPALHEPRGRVLGAIPPLKAKVVCPCNGKSEVVEIKG